jgi:hypothetical protein
MKPQANTTLIACTLSALGLLAGCGGGGSGSGTDSGSGSRAGGGALVQTAPGSLSFNMIDSPMCGYNAVNVSISKIRIHPSAAAAATDLGWIDIDVVPPRKINLRNPTTGPLDLLAKVMLPPGHYTQIRLVLAANQVINPLANSVVKLDGKELPMDLTNGEGIIRMIHPFDVTPEGAVDLSFNFDACSSVIDRGNMSYLLRPVVYTLQPANSGAIIGSVDPTVFASHAMVTAQQDGVIIKAVMPDAMGNFSLSPISAGSYDVVATADGRTTNIIAGVVVTADNDTLVSTQGSPLQMPISTTATYSGEIMPWAAEADVKVSQSITMGPTVQVASRLSSYIDGSYSMTLPSTAPMAGWYGTGGLPIVMLAHAPALGKYTVQASAPGYMAKSAVADLSKLNLVQDFTLVMP